VAPDEQQVGQASGRSMSLNTNARSDDCCDADQFFAGFGAAERAGP
jgi:hypothetical protein